MLAKHCSIWYLETLVEMTYDKQNALRCSRTRDTVKLCVCHVYSSCITACSTVANYRLLATFSWILICGFENCSRVMATLTYSEGYMLLSLQNLV